MPAQNPPIFVQSGSHPAEDVRRWIATTTGGVQGVFLPGDLVVTQNGTPNMSVNVATGRVFINGTENTYQGTYFGENRGTTNLLIAASNATNPRRDLVVARIRDAVYSGATSNFALEVLTGTAAASPVDPTVPANCVVLARVQVNAGVTTIGNASITDLRPVAGTVASLQDQINAVVESGISGNVRWTKFQDGTMIQGLNESVTNQAIADAYSTIWTGTRTYSFPIAFVGTPASTVGLARWGNGGSWGSVSACTNASITIRLHDFFSRATGTATQISWVAYGRWV
jgi:hypothetical protein